ncbi:hypothetical protein [Halosimplex marinum]|uniref:hypothetical protein n=1 Tax=Halosimplex marinum TaxID=3396620 RepID=UPI003F55D7E4
MKRRTLLALLGAGSAGGAAVLYPERTESLVGGGTGPEDAPAEGPSDWGRRLQSELDDPSYGDVSFATTARSVTVDDDVLSAVDVEPSASGDAFLFEAASRDGAERFAAMLDGTLGLGTDVEFRASVDGETVRFAGGESAVGPVAGASAVREAEPVVVLVRASDPADLESVAASLEP